MGGWYCDAIGIDMFPFHACRHACGYQHRRLHCLCRFKCSRCGCCCHFGFPRFRYEAAFPGRRHRRGLVRALESNNSNAAHDLEPIHATFKRRPHLRALRTHSCASLDNVTASPSFNACGGSTTTVSPADTPDTTCLSLPMSMPVFTSRRATWLSLPRTKTRLVPSRCSSDATGTRTPFGVFCCCAVAFSKKLTRTPMSGTMRASLTLSATRTLTVALPRSAAGMIAITLAGMRQSG